MNRSTTTRTATHLGRGKRVLSWICQLLAAGILAQTLFFKFTYAPETRIIFADLGGRPAASATGLAELLCVVLLVVPATAAVGAVLSLFVIGGALATHLLLIGIEIVDPATGQGDGGLLFGLAIAVAVLAATVAVLRKGQLVAIVGRVRRLRMPSAPKLSSGSDARAD